jgi:thymidylate kinase
MRQEHQLILNKYATDVIIFDRYFDSTYVYGNELMTDLTANANYDTAFFMAPRATIYLYGDPNILSKRKDPIDFFSSTSKETIINRMELYKAAFIKYPLNRKIFRVDTSKKNIKQTAKLCANFIKTMVKREVE